MEKYNDKWHAEKDKLYIQLEEISKLDKQFYERADTLLGFTDNAYEYYLKGNLAQKRKIIEIISEKITYKDKHFNLTLKPVFETIAKNQYILNTQNAKNRTPEKVDDIGIDPKNSPEYRKNSPGWTRTNNPSVNSRMLCH